MVHTPKSNFACANPSKSLWRSNLINQVRVQSCRCVVSVWARSRRAGQGRAGQGKVHVYYFTDTPQQQLTGFPVRSLVWTLLLGPPGQIKKKKMTTLDPLKSAISIMNVDDTSLALPSVNQYRSGQQRVLEQVQTVRRNKSKHSSSKSGSASLSPTSKSSRYTRATARYSDGSISLNFTTFNQTKLMIK